MPIIEITQEAADAIAMSGFESASDAIMAGVKANSPQAEFFALTAQQDGTAVSRKTIFDYWLMRMGKNANTKMTAERKRVIDGRMRDGYSVDDCRAAIDGCARSAFHMGENNTGTLHNDLTLILRNGSKLEQFRDNTAVVQSHLIAKRSGQQSSTRDISTEQMLTDTSWAE